MAKMQSKYPRYSEYSPDQQKHRAKWLFGWVILFFLISLGLLMYIHTGGLCKPELGGKSETAQTEAVEAAQTGAEPGTAETETGQADAATEAGATEEQDSSAELFGACVEPPGQWLDWFLASVLGVLTYMMIPVYEWYRSDKAMFIEYTPWYISTPLKAPVLAFVVLIFLTNLDIKIAGLELDFTQLNAPLLLMIAFVLGFFSRVTREQLNQIVKSIFSKAYSRAEEKFLIEPASATVVFGQSTKFYTTPYTDVTWVANVGTIEDGLYVAPDSGDKDAVPDRVVNIIAVPKDENIERKHALVTLIPFKISGDEQIPYGEKRVYQVDPDQDPVKADDSGVNWSVAPVIPGAKVDLVNGNLEYTAPSRAEADAAKVNKVLVTAVHKVHAERQMSLEVNFID